MLKDISNAALKTDKPELLARIVNVVGRFRRIDFESFKTLLLNFESMCAKENVGIDVINTFLDGIVQSRIIHGEASVKKMLT